MFIFGLVAVGAGALWWITGMFRETLSRFCPFILGVGVVAFLGAVLIAKVRGDDE
jgi:hypothetical protein